MVKLQSRLERRLPTGCIEIPVALPGIRVFVRARPPRVDLLYSCPHCGETSRGAQEAGNEVKGEKARRTRSRQRPSNEMVSLKRDRGNVPRPNLVNDNSAIPVFPWNRACNLDFLGERLSSDASIDTYAWQGRTNGPRVKP